MPLDRELLTLLPLFTKPVLSFLLPAFNTLVEIVPLPLANFLLETKMLRKVCLLFPERLMSSRITTTSFGFFLGFASAGKVISDHVTSVEPHTID